jgi:hypothetical protein
LKASRCFGGTYRLHPQSRRINQAKHRHKSGDKVRLFFGSENEGDMFLRNIGWLSVEYTELIPRRRNRHCIRNINKLLHTESHQNKSFVEVELCALSHFNSQMTESCDSEIFNCFTDDIITPSLIKTASVPERRVRRIEGGEYTDKA